MSEVEEKYEALARYIKAYDLDTLPTLMFPKEDAEYLLLACEKQIPKKVNIEYDDEFTCPTCGETTEDYDVTTLKVCPECGQNLKWDQDSSFEQIATEIHDL